MLLAAGEGIDSCRYPRPQLLENWLPDQARLGGTRSGTWYLARHAEARQACAGQVPGAAICMAYYLQTSAAGLGHSPSPLFDEQFYLARKTPMSRRRSSAGQLSPPVSIIFVRHGHRERSRRTGCSTTGYTAACMKTCRWKILTRNDCFGRYDHYLKAGQREDRTAQFHVRRPVL